MGILLTSDNINRLAAERRIEAALINTIGIVEASGAGFDPKTGLIKIQFEPAWFEKLSRTKILNGVEGQAEEWKAYKEAAAINTEAAMLATSWGRYQIMGFNFKSAGFKSVQDMVGAFKLSELNQLIGMMNFVEAHLKMHQALIAKNWAGFAFEYNGPNYKINNYDVKLAQTYARLTKI
jgi:hypothetical protein